MNQNEITSAGGGTLKPFCCGYIKQGIQTIYIFNPDRLDQVEVDILQIGSPIRPIPAPERREHDGKHRVNA